MKKFTLLLVFAIFANVFLTSNLFGQIAQVTGSPQTATTTNTTLTITKPSGLAVNNVMLLQIVQSGDGAVGSITDLTLAGWTQIAGSYIENVAGTVVRATLYYKIAVASDVSATNFTFTLDGDSDDGEGGIIAFSGVDITGGVNESGAAGGPFDVDPGSVYTNISSTNNLFADPISTTNTATVIMFGAISNNYSISLWEATDPATFTEIYDVPFNATEDIGMGAAFAGKSGAGSTGVGQADLTGTDFNGSIFIALKPVAVSPAVSWLQPSLPWATLLINNNSNPYQVERNGDINWPGGNGTFNFVYSVSPNSGFSVASGALVTNNTTSTTTVPLVLNFTTAGIYTITCTVTENGGGSIVASQTRTIEVLATTPTIPTLWATSSSGTIVSSWVVNQGTYIGGPTTVFTPTFTGTNGGTSTAALGVYSTIPGDPATRFYYYLPNNGGGTNGVVTIYGANSSGTIAEVGTIDMNGASNNSLGFVRLGMRADGVGFILAGDGTTVYLAKFATNGILPATVSMEDANGVTIVGGTAGIFQNGDLALSGSGTIYALANDGSGATHIYKGTPNGNSTTFTKVFDLLDNLGAPFTGSVNGIAFDNFGSLYISTAAGIFYLNSQTVNGAGGTVACNLVWSITGLQDLGSDAFPQQTILPVSLGSFSVTKQGDFAVLNWKTTTEINTDHFEIERSYDGVSFTKVAAKTAAGNSSADINYQHSDPINYNYQIVYYRLKTVDIDAKSSYSKIVALRLSNGPIRDLTVFPNPFTTDLKLQISSLTETTGLVRISNSVGQVVYIRNIVLQKGENIVVLNSGLETLKPGMHLMEVITTEGKTTQKIIKR